MSNDPQSLTSLYKSTLFEDILPFWVKHSLDTEAGGYFTCLDRQGDVYDTDKFIWLQCRQVWLFSMLYNRVEKNDEWLQIAKHGTRFLMDHGMDDDGNWYFSLDRHGNPLIQPYNIFSDCFAAMAFSQFHLATGDERARTLALNTYRNILRRRENPKGKYNKAYPGTRPMVSLALPMILANLSLEMEHLLDKRDLQDAVQSCIDQIMSKFFDEASGLLFENVAPDGTRLDCFEGRLINPGHGIEAMWFLMDIAERRRDRALIDQCIRIVLNILNFGWDQRDGGIFYMMDAQGRPPQQLEWDQKLWWVHLETLVALSMAWRLTGNRECCDWYRRVHDYAWNHFPDPDYGEWFGYLNRQGQRILDLKGGKWKGCFHVPRALFLCWQQFEQMETSKENSGA